MSGLTIFANIGPNLSVTIQTHWLRNVSVADEFISVGFNQSKHSITLQTNVKLEIVMPFSKNVMEVNNSIPLAESIIVGPVPDTFLIGIRKNNRMRGRAVHKEFLPSPLLYRSNLL